MANWTDLEGIAAAAVAAACFDGAVLLQASEAQAVDAAHGLRLSLLARLARRRRWLLGTAIAVLGWPLQLLALALAPVTVVQPTLAVGLVLLLAGGSRLLGERVGRREWVAVAAVIAGVAALAAGAPSHTESRPALAVGALCLGGLGLIVVTPFLRRGSRPRPWSLIVPAGAAFALSALTSKLVTVELAHGHLLAAVGWVAATAVASAAGFLVDMTALQRFDATRVAPPMFVLETAVPVALAPLLFHEHWGSGTGGAPLVLAGLALTLGGGVVLGASRSVVAADSAIAGGDLQDDVGGGRELPIGEVRLPR